MADVRDEATVPAAVERLRLERAALEAFEADRPTEPGRWSPRRRVEELVDAGSFLELGPLTRSQQRDTGETFGDGLVAGWAKMAGHEVGVLAEDPLVLGRTDAQVARNKRLRILNTCAIRGNPIVYLADGPSTPRPTFPPGQGDLFAFMGRQWPEPPPSALAYPTVTVVLGRCEGRAAEIAAASHVVIAVPEGRMSATPGGEGVLDPSLVDRVVSGDAAAIEAARLVFTLLPSGEPEAGPVVPRPPASPLSDRLIPGGPLRELLDGLFAPGSVTRLHEGAGCVAGEAELGGHAVVFAAVGDGALVGTDELRAVAHASRLSRARSVPLLLVQDTPGYDPRQAHDGVFLRTLSEALDLVRTATAPKLCVVAGQGHVLGTFALGGRQLGIDFVAALPFSRVAALDVASYFPGAVPEGAVDGPWLAAGLGHVDEILAPSELHDRLAVMLTLFAHGAGVPPPEADRAGRYVDDIPKV